jgi:hypothetical protein
MWLRAPKARLLPKEVVRVFARVSTIQGQPESAEEGIRVVREQVLPAVRGLQGFKGMLALIDRSTGKSVGITLWASEEDLLASEDAAGRIRASSTQTGDGRVLGVERYEVIVDEPVGSGGPR